MRDDRLDLPQLAEHVVALEELSHDLAHVCTQALGSRLPVRAAAVTKAQLEELKYFGFRTVEDVANCPDSITTRFVGFQVLKRRAQTFLDVQAQNAPTEKLQAEVKVRDEQIAGMQNVINELQTKVNELLKASGKK